MNTMNPMADMFDFQKNMDNFSKFFPTADFGAATPLKAVTDFAAKYREVTTEALNRHVELTTAWMKDAAKDATTLKPTPRKPVKSPRRPSRTFLRASSLMPKSQRKPRPS